MGVKDIIKETDLLVKENVKSNKSLTQNIQEIQDTMKRPNLRIIWIEGEGQLKGTENILNKIIEENFLNLKKDISMRIQESYRTPDRLDQKKFPLPYCNQNTKLTEQKKNIKNCKGKRPSNI